ncbi:chemotaxis protein CheW [Wolinella succinogenes]|uniref:chemotaxis protein CheW n=1 Tax=Wolinella succinogenes TaxID=844 RepID=UPI002FCC677F
MKSLHGELSDSKRYLFFFLEGERFGMDISFVQEIVRFQNCIPLPKAPDYFLGMMNLRGKNIPILHLAKRLGFSHEALHDHPVVILAKLQGKEAGLLVDRVDEVGGVGEEILSQGTIHSLCETFTQGIAKDQHLQKAVILLKTEALLEDLTLDTKQTTSPL